jgi:alkylated DNA repair dioxygenase AlkB
VGFLVGTRASEYFDGAVLYVPHFLGEADATDLFTELRASVQWRQESTRLYGKDIPIPRLTAWYGEGRYTYSGINNSPQAWTSTLALLRDSASVACGGASFNSVLLNLYRDGADSVAWHADDERELGEEPTIAAVSLGEERRFQIRSNDDHTDKIDLILEHGSLLIMRGRSQRDLKHQVPKVGRKRGVRERINLTFRYIAPTDS